MTTGLHGRPLSERQERVLRAVRNLPGSPTAVLGSRVGLSPDKALYHLNALYVARLIDRVQLVGRSGVGCIWWPHTGPYGIGSPGASGAP